MKRLVAYLVGLTLVMMFSAGVGAETVWKAATDATFPPFESVDVHTGELIGFDMDLVRAIDEYLTDVKIEIVNVAWDGLIPGLLNGNYDFIAAAMTITPERAMAVDFTVPYFEASQVIIVRADNDSIQGPEDLKDKYVTVQIGTTGDLYVTDYGIKRIGRFNTAPEALLEVQNGNAHAMVVDEAVAKEFVAANPGDIKIVGVPFTDEAYGMAVKKGNTEVLTKLNEAIAALKANGTYDKIYQKYFAK